MKYSLKVLSKHVLKDIREQFKDILLKTTIHRLSFCFPSYDTRGEKNPLEHIYVNVPDLHILNRCTFFLVFFSYSEEPYVSYF